MFTIEELNEELIAHNHKIVQLEAQVQEIQNALLAHIDQVNDIMANFRREINKG